MKEIHVFDIDGCVLTSQFPNISENNQSGEKGVREVLEISEKVSLFPEFLIFYENRCKVANEVIFLTGRQESEFGKLTRNQLKPLEEIRAYRIYFYPEEKSHRAKEYFDWKVVKIQEIFDSVIKRANSSHIPVNHFVFRIFDDMSDYFSRIKNIAERFNLTVSLTLINRPKDWKALIK